MPEPPVEVRDIRKRFGAVEALRGVRHRLEPGEVFGYLGPNGAGKTTTLRVVLGLAHPTSGEARVFGRPASDAASREPVGFLPGDLHLYDDMQAGAVLDYFARFRRSRPPVLRARLLEALALAPDALRRRVKFLSHGTRQKLGLIVAMQHDPPLLLLDEPSIGLDPLVQHAFRDLVLDFAARGRTVLFSSHVLSEVEAVCGRVAILRAGKIVALQTIGTLRESVVRRLCVRFRGAPPLGLTATPGVTRFETVGPDLVLWLQGDVNPILRALACADIEHLVFPEPELEDIFLTYYREERPHA